MVLSEIDGLGLIELKLNELSLVEAWDRLQEGKYIILASYEETRGLDVLVRLDKRKYTVTQISFDTSPIEYGERYWTIHNVSINALSLGRVFAYDEDLYSIEHKYNPDSIVYYDDGETPRQIAVVDKVYTSSHGDIYYTLDNETGYYAENELFDDSGLLT